MMFVESVCVNLSSVSQHFKSKDQLQTVWNFYWGSVN